jgi:hypothetical protein
MARDPADFASDHLEQNIMALTFYTKAHPFGQGMEGFNRICTTARELGG